MTDAKKPVIVVVGATGNQGGSVIDSLLATKKFSLRGVTRSAKPEQVNALKAKGVEVVVADMKKKDTLVAAFKGAWGVFCVTQFWDPEVMKNPELEFEAGKNQVDAALEAKVSVLIWSGLGDCDGVSGKKWHVPHFTNKWRVEEYARKHKEIDSIFVYAGFYAQNFMGFMPPKPLEDGTLAFHLPVRADVGVPLFDVSDTGRWVAPIFEDHKKWVGKVIPMTSGYITLPEVAATFARVTGQKAKYVQIPLEAFKDNHEMMHMFGWFNQYGYLNGQTLDESHSICSNANTWESFLRKTGWKGK